MSSGRERSFFSTFNALRKTRLFIVFSMMGMSTWAQEGIPSGNAGIQIGVNAGILDNVIGPSFSLHYAWRSEKVVQLESMLFLDQHSGKAFISGHDQRNFGMGLSFGARLNLLPKKNWNPSLFLLPGIMYSSEKISRPDAPESKGISGALCFGVANTFFKKHLLSLGFHQGANMTSLNLKYGYWF